MRAIIAILFLGMLSACNCLKTDSDTTVISLKGKWNFQLDPSDKGVGNKWFAKKLEDEILLPSTTDVQQKGELNTKTEYGRFTRLYPYGGPAWYQKEIEVPENWQGKQLLFFMELTKASSVWVDEHYIGKEISLTAPHIYNLSKYLTPGRHLISVRIDNKDNPPVGWPHQISDQTQTNWNGILGRIELQVKDVVYIKDVQVYPNVHEKKADVKVKFNQKSSGKLTLEADAWNTSEKHHVKAREYDIETLDNGECVISLPIGDNMLLWDEFNPALYKLKVKYEGKFNSEGVRDYKEVDFGMRDFTVNGTQFQVNGKTVFLRGKHESHVFPITGHVPMEVDEWVRIFKIAKSYGMNHYRYHTCVPCEAAFKAADIVGIYLEPQLPRWGQVGDSKLKFTLQDVEMKKDSSDASELVEYMLFEGYKILETFGNHASFCMFSLGNELHGDRQLMSDMVSKFRAFDNRHLYASGSNNFLWNPKLSPGDDFWTTTFSGGSYSPGNYHPNTKGLDTRSSYPVHTEGHINNIYPSTTVTYEGGIKNVPVPIISHENGQFQVYPNFDEIEKFTGVVRAKNYEAYRDRLEKAGMLDQARDFFRASGALAAICYRADVETAIRTKGFGGYQMLDLQDFPGQGTALVGMLDVFMDSKGIISPEKWREFSSEVVPLLQMEKYTWTNDEEFNGLVSLANYGADKINTQLKWELMNDSGELIAKGEIKANVPQGKVIDLESVRIDLSEIPAPQKLELNLVVEGTQAKNAYPIWLYPSKVMVDTVDNIIISNTLDDKTVKILENGADVLLFPDSTLLKNAIEGAFQSDFWCYPMFKKYSPPGTLGILCNPAHPIFNDFPTDFHSNWQWWPMLKHGKAMILDNTPDYFRPIVQVVDNFERNHKLGVVFECKVGRGKLLVCSAALQNQQQYPEARQLLYSIQKYMKSEEFMPQHCLTLKQIEEILANKS